MDEDDEAQWDATQRPSVVMKPIPSIILMVLHFPRANGPSSVRD